MIVTLVGWLGADAKETDKGFNFSLSQKNWENNVGHLQKPVFSQISLRV